MERMEGKLKVALSALSQAERQDIIYDLDLDYGGGVWEEP